MRPAQDSQRWCSLRSARARPRPRLRHNPARASFQQERRLAGRARLLPRIWFGCATSGRSIRRPSLRRSSRSRPMAEASRSSCVRPTRRRMNIASRWWSSTFARATRPKVIDRGGDPLMLNIGLRGIADFPTGIIDVVTPRWSPDGRWIAFLKRIDGRTQVWRAKADGSGSRPITRSANDVVDFRIGAGGSSLIYATVPVLDRTRAAIDREGLTGFHYDDRLSPFAVNRPFVPSPVQRETEVLDLETGKLREATKTEASPLAQGGNVIAVEGAPGNAQSEPGLSISATTTTGGADKGALHAMMPGGSLKTCAEAMCEGAIKPWWIAPGAKVRFFRREGWARASTAIYEWNLRSGSVRRLYLTEDVLADCAPQTRP